MEQYNILLYIAICNIVVIIGCSIFLYLYFKARLIRQNKEISENLELAETRLQNLIVILTQNVNDLKSNLDNQLDKLSSTIHSIINGQTEVIVNETINSKNLIVKDLKGNIDNQLSKLNSSIHSIINGQTEAIVNEIINSKNIVINDLSDEIGKNRKEAVEFITTKTDNIESIVSQLRKETKTQIDKLISEIQKPLEL